MYRFFVYTNLFLAIAAAVFSAGIIKLFSIHLNFNYPVFLFFATIFTYNFQRLLKYKSEPEKQIPFYDWLNKNESIIRMLLLIAGLNLLYYLPSLLKANRIGILGLIVSTMISLFYVVKWKKMNLRTIPFVKMYVISFVWVLAVAWIPFLLQAKYSLTQGLHLGILILFFLSICIPFDIRDIEFDQQQLKTLPQVIGENLAKWVALSLGIIYCFLQGLMLMKHQFIYYFVASLFYLSILFLTNRKRKEFFYAVGVDATILLFGLSFLLS